MPESREDEKFKQDAIDDDLESLEELLGDTYLSAPGVSRRPRVEVGLELLLKGAKKGYTIDELVDDLDGYVVTTYLSALLAAGANPDKLASRLGDEDLVKHLDELLNAGAKIDINSLIAKLDHGYIVGHLDELLAAGADPDKLAARLDAKDIAYNLNKLQKAGAEIDVNKLVSQLTPRPIVDNLDELRKAGVEIDLDRLMKKVSPAMVRDDLDQLLRAGADINSLIAKLNRGYIVSHLAELLATGANPDELVSRLRDEDVVKHLDELRKAGAEIDVDKLVSQLTPWSIVDNLDELRKAGAEIDFDKLIDVDGLDSYVIDIYLAELLAAGANPDRLVSRLRDEDVVKHLDELLDAGVEINVDKLIDKIPDKSKIIWALPKLVAAGANKDKLGRKLGELLDDGRYLYDFLGNLDVIRESGVDGVTPDRLMQGLEERSIRCLGIKPFYIADKLDALLRFGVDPDRLARLANSRPYLLDVRQWGDKLRAAGADPELLQPRLGR